MAEKDNHPGPALDKFLNTPPLTAVLNKEEVSQSYSYIQYCKSKHQLTIPNQRILHEWRVNYEDSNARSGVIASNSVSRLTSDGRSAQSAIVVMEEEEDIEQIVLTTACTSNGALSIIAGFESPSFKVDNFVGEDEDIDDDILLGQGYLPSGMDSRAAATSSGLQQVVTGSQMKELSDEKYRVTMTYADDTQPARSSHLPSPPPPPSVPSSSGLHTATSGIGASDSPGIGSDFCTRYPDATDTAAVDKLELSSDEMLAKLKEAMIEMENDLSDETAQIMSRSFGQTSIGTSSTGPPQSPETVVQKDKDSGFATLLPNPPLSPPSISTVSGGKGNAAADTLIAGSPADAFTEALQKEQQKQQSEVIETLDISDNEDSSSEDGNSASSASGAGEGDEAGKKKVEVHSALDGMLHALKEIQQTSAQFRDIDAQMLQQALDRDTKGGIEPSTKGDFSIIQTHFNAPGLDYSDPKQTRSYEEVLPFDAAGGGDGGD